MKPASTLDTSSLPAVRHSALPAGSGEDVELNDFGCVPKLCGADIELGNALIGREQGGGTADEAAQRLLQGIRENARDSWCDGPTTTIFSSSGFYSNSQDWGRTFLACNGGCSYIDLGHAELCLPEVRSARDFVACWHAMLRIARDGLDTANSHLTDGRRIVALVNNSDGQGHSYGGHVSVLVRRATWDNMFNRRLHHALLLAAHQASSVVLTGAGKVGTENGVPPQPFVISQRADFFVALTGPQTTYDRPVVNTRDEALCGSARAGSTPANQFARVHVIFYDTTLGHVTNYLKVGMLQFVLAMLEAGHLNPRLLLDDPVAAALTWSHDPGLSARARLADGSRLTAVEHQLLVLEEARKFFEAGGCAGVVPEADQILALWEDTLAKLKQADFDALMPRLDWVLKLRMLDKVRQQRGFDWSAPQLKQLDFAFCDLEKGLYWLYEREHVLQQLVSSAQIERFVHQPPEDTRAWLRAHLLRLGGQNMDHADWDRLRFRFSNPRGWPTWRTLDLCNPLGFTKASCEAMFNDQAPLEVILDRLEGMAEPTPSP